MKLEVGQKIGIYEALRSDYFCIKSGQYYLGEKEDFYSGFSLFTQEYPKKLLYFGKSEVRKVGSLIVKRLK